MVGPPPWILSMHPVVCLLLMFVYLRNNMSGRRVNTFCDALYAFYLFTNAVMCQQDRKEGTARVNAMLASLATCPLAKMAEEINKRMGCDERGCVSKEQFMFHFNEALDKRYRTCKFAFFCFPLRSSLFTDITC